VPSKLHFIKGDVLQPRGSNRRIIGHVVSDATQNWGGSGVAVSLKKKWPAAQERFRSWVADQHRPKLGSVHFCPVAENIEVASMVCQHGMARRQKARACAMRPLRQHFKPLRSTPSRRMLRCISRESGAGKPEARGWLFKS
jgi:hypothetical protein